MVREISRYVDLKQSLSQSGSIPWSCGWQWCPWERTWERWQYPFRQKCGFMQREYAKWSSVTRCWGFKDGGSSVWWWSGLGLGVACGCPGCGVRIGSPSSVALEEGSPVCLCIVGEGFCLGNCVRFLWWKVHLSVFSLQLAVPSYCPVWRETTLAVVLS